MDAEPSSPSDMTRPSRRLGFHFTWIRFVVALALAAALWLSYIIPHIRTQSKVFYTQGLIMAIDTALEAYKTDNGQYPPPNDCARLLTGSADSAGALQSTTYMTLTRHELNARGDILDGWRKPLRFTVDAQGMVITSSGRDKIFGTQDDISNRNVIANLDAE